MLLNRARRVNDYTHNQIECEISVIECEWHAQPQATVETEYSNGEKKLFSLPDDEQ